MSRQLLPWLLLLLVVASAPYTWQPARQTCLAEAVQVCMHLWRLYWQVAFPCKPGWAAPVSARG